MSEAYKITDAKIKESDFKQRPNINTTIEPFDNLKKFPSPSTTIGDDQPKSMAYQYYQEFESDNEYDSDDEMECSDVLKHIQSCQICQSKLIQDTSFKLSDDVMDFLLYTITGTFILFLLDMVLRLGKNLT